MEIQLLAFTSLAVWGFIWHRAKRRSLLRWASPQALFSAGLLLLYIIPSLYWQFRPWNYIASPYFEGLGLVFAGLLTLSIPFFVYELLCAAAPTSQRTLAISHYQFGTSLWVAILPILVGMGWQIYLVTLGWQGKLARELPALMGSQNLALLVRNFLTYYPAFYFLLIVYGNRMLARVGGAFWIMDGFIQFFLISRYHMIRFILLSLVFSTLIRGKFRLWHWVVAAILGVFILAIIGWSYSILGGYMIGGRPYLSPPEVLKALKESSIQYAKGDVWGEAISPEANPLLRSLDDAMFRLYDARSASAVMMNVGGVVPYYYGRTLNHILYVFIPRYLWPEKPHLDDIHKVSALVMYPEYGNPVGTVAELYMNFGLVAVLVGGFGALLLCRWGEWSLSRPDGISPTLLCMYPILSELYIFASYNFTQRICEAIRGLAVMAMIGLAIRFLRRYP